MIDLLLGVPKLLNDLLARLSASWASNITSKVNNLDATMLSRAAAATAVSSANYTAGRAALLDGIIQNTVIAGIQTGYASNAGVVGASEDILYFDVTITAVSAINKCLVIVQGFADNSQNVTLIATGRLTSTTNLRLSSPGTVVRGRWYVIEFK